MKTVKLSELELFLTQNRYRDDNNQWHDIEVGEYEFISQDNEMRIEVLVTELSAIWITKINDNKPSRGEKNIFCFPFGSPVDLEGFNKEFLLTYNFCLNPRKFSKKLSFTCLREHLVLINDVIQIMETRIDYSVIVNRVFISSIYDIEFDGGDKIGRLTLYTTELTLPINTNSKDERGTTEQIQEMLNFKQYIKELIYKNM